MKRSTIANTFAIAALTALALGTSPLAKADNKGCSVATLKGTFAYTASGFTVAPAPVGAYAEAGTQTFDGKGGVTLVGMASANGNIMQAPTTGTYTLNADCTGTFTFPLAPGISSHYFFALSDSGAGFQAVCVDPVGIITRNGRRQYPEADWRQ